MSDKIKEATFSMLASLGVEPDRVLDLYAGTGSIGIEALSRGGSSADFVDENAAACAVIRANLALTGFVDPPYAAPDIVDVLGQLAGSALVQSGSIVVIGHSPRVTLPEQVGRLERLRTRCHGDSCVSIYEAADEAPSEDGGASAGGTHA
jgi:16S rRNA (guanine966-N2)-methyltransferase